MKARSNNITAKRILNPAATLMAVVFLMTACADELNLNPHSAISPDGISEGDLPALRMGMYNSVQNRPTREGFIMFDILGGMLAQTGGDPRALINSTLSPLNGAVSSNWSGYFSALYQVNNVLDITASVPESALATRIKGEAHYFRAYIYSCLISRWGPVPILRKNTMDLVERDDEEKVWAFIEEDLETAISLLGDPVDGYYYLSRNAAIALKARIKLHQGKMQEARDAAEYLIQETGYRLDAFSKIFRKAQNTEVIFAFENLAQESSITISTLFYSYAHPNNGSWVYRPTEALMQLYSDGDLRKDISITSMGGNDMVNKYPSGQAGTDPVVISRLAEMYLISAEAQGRVNGIDRLNQLREFRGLDPIYPANDDAYIDAILQERRKEFLGEGFLYYDLVRTGRAATEIGLLPYQHVLPIPGRELLLNPKLTPNSGY